MTLRLRDQSTGGIVGGLPGLRGYRSGLVKVSDGPPPLYRWQDEKGYLWGEAKPYTEMFADSTAIAAASAAPGALSTYVSSLSPQIIDGSAPETVRFKIGDAESNDYPATATTWKGVGSKPDLYLNEYTGWDSANAAGALSMALADLSAAGGGVLHLPPADISITLTTASAMFSVPSNVRVVGIKGKTNILLTSDDPSSFRYFVGGSGNNIFFENLSITRNSDCKLLFFIPGAVEGLRLSHVTLDGKFDVYGTNNPHGVCLDGVGAKSNITLEYCKIRGMRYGLFQSNGTTNTVDRISVFECDFEDNYDDDLAFNAPNSAMSNITVMSSRFKNNHATAGNSGFGVDFAHVIGGSIWNCEFESYYNEAIHVEDYSTGVKISQNRLKSCGTGLTGSINVITGCSDIIVADNTLDQTANTNTQYGILVLKSGGSGTTPGGRAEIAPSKCKILNNTIYCGTKYKGIYVENSPGTTVNGNHVYGAGVVSAGAWDEGNTGSGITTDGVGVKVDSNTVSGFRYGIRGPLLSRNGVSDGGTVFGNALSSCYIGIAAVSPGSVSINGNTVSNCVRPGVLGEGSVASKPASFTGNVAVGCVYPWEINGKLVLIRGTLNNLTVGTARNLWVKDNMLALPVGTVIQFAGGGVFTTTSAVSSVQTMNGSVYQIPGDVTGTTIASTELYGTATGMAYSQTAANNHVMLGMNMDSVAGVYA